MAEETEIPAVPVEEEAVGGLFTDQPPDGGGDAPNEGDGGSGGENSQITTAAEQPVTPEGKKLQRLKTPGGSVYIAETEHELLQKLYNAQVAAEQAIADRENQIRTLKATPAALPQQPTHQAPASKTPIPDGAYDDQVYLDLLGKDTIAARRYQDRFIYGDIDPVQALQQSYTVANETKQRAVVADFLSRNPDYPQTPEAGAKLESTMGSYKLPMTLVNMEWTYNELKRTGAIQPAVAPTMDPNEYQDVTFGAPNVPPQRPSSGRGAGAPPTPRASANNNAAEVVDAATMPLKELEALLRKKGALQF